MKTRYALLAMTLFYASVARAEPAVALEELHRLIAEKQYAPAIQKITAALGLKGPAAKGVDRYSLFMLKGECHLQLRAIRPAQEAYIAAAKEAPSPRERAVAEAYGFLLKSSRALAYTPKTAAAGDKTARPAPIDILDPASRRRAFAALFADELAAADSKLAAARAAISLPPIVELFKPLATLEGLELASSADATDAPRTAALRGEMTDRAKKVVADALRGIDKTVSRIDKSANTFIEFYQDTVDVIARPVRVKRWKKKGLTDDEMKDLQSANATCDKISPALAEIAKRLAADEKAFETQTEEAARIRKEVDRILDTDYQHVYDQPPKK